MYNLQPGQGLGGSASNLLAYGLGPSIVEFVEQVLEYHGGGQRGDAWDKELLGTWDIQKEIREDEEVMEIILQLILSGVLD